MKLPLYNESSRKGEKGITILKNLIESEIGWILRINHLENDFGIDAYIDVIEKASFVTGKTIATQVKTGSSYFKEKNEFGWVYRDEISHLNYYLNHDIPVIIIIINEKDEKAYWALCDPSETERAGENWKMTIPFNQELKKESKEQLKKYISPTKDYASQLEHYWYINSEIKKAGRVFLVTDKSDIESESYNELLMSFNRIKMSKSLISKVREKIDIFITGYDQDSRELYEIPEFKTWVKSIFDKMEGWGYFLSKDENSHFLRLIQLCYMKYKVLPEKTINENGLESRKLEFIYDENVFFLEKLYDNLNKFCDEYHISEKINKEISYNILSYLSGE